MDTVTDVYGNVTYLSGWKFLSPHGYKVRILADKALIIETAPKQNDLKFD